jgi:hypothetical protein
MFEALMKDLQNVPETAEPEAESGFGESGDPVKEFQQLWETAANQFSATSKSLDELSARLDQSQRQTVPELMRTFRLLLMEATVLIRTLHKKIEKEQQVCKESEKITQ